jgi:hypothetical protein
MKLTVQSSYSTLSLHHGIQQVFDVNPVSAVQNQLSSYALFYIRFSRNPGKSCESTKLSINRLTFLISPLPQVTFLTWNKA